MTAQVHHGPNPDAEAALVLDWRKQQRTRAKVRVTIERVLDEGLPAAWDRCMSMFMRGMGW